MVSDARVSPDHPTVPSPHPTTQTQPISIAPDAEVVTAPAAVQATIAVTAPVTTAVVQGIVGQIADSMATPDARSGNDAEPRPDTGAPPPETTADQTDVPAANARAGDPLPATTHRPTPEGSVAVADRQVLVPASNGPPTVTSVSTATPAAGAPMVPFTGAQVSAWRHLRTGSTSTMSMDVDTETLGQLRIAASDLDGVVRVSLLSDDALSRNLLADRLPELRRDLADAGIDFADLDVANRDAGQRHSESSRQSDRSNMSPSGSPSGSSDRRIAAISPPQTVASGRLDLRL